MLDDLKKLLDGDPFVPFRLVLTSGSSHDVTSPYQIAIGQTQLDYYYPRSDKKAIVQLNQLVAFEVEESSRG